jgi:2-polyprenyl-3-methyl-5-hydroxy-6-metoxy-1,4-benzoquinol methylase
MNNTLYQLEPPDYYDNLAHSLNPLRRWWNVSRQDQVAKLVKAYYHGGTIIDLGCGDVLWNNKLKLPVLGVDLNPDALSYAHKIGRITSSLCCDINRLIPLPDNTANLIVCSEVLEHIASPILLLNNIHRLLKINGHLIASVPYDTAFSLWQPLFALQCWWSGRVDGDKYYQQKCGHINHYSPQSFKKLLSLRFTVEVLYSFHRLTIFAVAKKEEYDN